MRQNPTQLGRRLGLTIGLFCLMFSWLLGNDIINIPQFNNLNLIIRVLIISITTGLLVGIGYLIGDFLSHLFAKNK